MLNMSEFMLFPSLLMIVVALTCYVLALTLGKSAQKAPAAVPAHVGGRAEGGTVATDVAPSPAPAQRGSLAQWGTNFSRLAWLFLTALLIMRTISTGHGPFTNQYEFSVAFAWGMVTAYIYFEHRYHVRTIALLVLPISTALLLYAWTVGAESNPLVPALQNNLLLTIHVAVAIVAYGAFSISFAAAILYLTQPEGGRPGWPKPALMDEIGYRAVIIGFPLLTMTVVLGAVWAEIAWGSYWSWDPKETASLLTWLIYGAYLHARVARGWVGRRAAWLLVLGFASVLLTFFGNLFFAGSLHSYAK
jgi:ABC-type transport system involved in cytochrome c biogenesis permease subunit